MATRNRLDYLPVALDGLLSQEGCAAEIIVVDDASTDGTVAYVERRAAESRLPIRLIRSDRNLGPAGARNLGWLMSDAPWIAFTDDDCRPADGWLASFLAAAERCGADLLQGRTVPDPRHERASIWDRSIRVERFNHLFQTCNLLVKRDLLERLGGFDEAFSFAGEDADMGWRAIKIGAATAFVRDALVHHAIRPSNFTEHLRSRSTWANGVRFYKHHPEARFMLTARVFYRKSHVRLLACLPILVTVTARQPKAALLLVVGLVSYRAYRIQPKGRGTLCTRMLESSETTIALLWEIVQFVRFSIRHRTLVL